MITDKFNNSLYDEITAFFRSLRDGNTSSQISVLAGVSGGADSIALISLLHFLKNRLNISRLGIAHVNHGLRGAESDGDEAFARDISDNLKIEFFTVKLDASQAADDKDGVENWARVERYNFFQEVRQHHGFDYIATAHTACDQAETIILRLMRGTGIRGLRGILPVREDGVIRPLLGVERGTLEAWLESQGQQHRTDSSNSDTKFTRNFVRAEIIPKMVEHNDRAIANIAACAESAARVWEIVVHNINSWTANYLIRVNESVFHVEKAGLDDTLIAPEALVTLFDEYGIVTSRLHINRVIRSKSLSSGEHLLPGGWKFYPTDDRVCFVKS